MRPDAIVLGLGVNGLTMARALARRGVRVHGVSFLPGDAGRWSRCCRLVDISHVEWTEDLFVSWLAAFGKSLGSRPAVFPTSDRLALWLARNRPALGTSLRFWGTDGDLLESILSKDRLSGLAADVGVLSPPALHRPTADRLRAWCAANPGPYLVKPRFAEAVDNPIPGMKNRVFHDRTALASFVEQVGADGLLVQRMLEGGDDWQYSVAGLCDRKGRIVTMGTKRKVVQYPPDSGITAHGIIPSTLDRDEEKRLFAAARALLGGMTYEGLFGLEFLKERETGALYLIDFNPRSLYTTSHFVACGLDLPHLSYRLLCGDDLGTHPTTPVLKEACWADLWGCAGAWRRLRGTGRLGLGRLIGILLRSRAHAVWSWRDPLPALRHSWRKFTALFRKSGRPAGRRAPARPIVKV